MTELRRQAVIVIHALTIAGRHLLTYISGMGFLGRFAQLGDARL